MCLLLTRKYGNIEIVSTSMGVETLSTSAHTYIGGVQPYCLCLTVIISCVESFESVSDSLSTW